MTPQFYRAVDPIFLTVLDLLERIAQRRRTDMLDERLKIKAALDQGGALIGQSDQWELAKYALVSWIDEVLVEAPWDGAEWWNNNTLEVELFNTRVCNEVFYTRAQEASAQTNRDALEVFYVCVVLGFRGLYREESETRSLADPLGLPPDLETWARQTVMAVRLGQGLPSLHTAPREGAGAPPLESTPLLVWSAVTTIFLLALSAIALLA